MVRIVKTIFYKILYKKKHVVYVGVTTRTVQARFREHIKTKGLNPKLYSIHEFDLITHPDMRTLEEFYQEKARVTLLEQKYIKEEISKGSQLLNLSPGGEWGSQILAQIRKDTFLQEFGTYEGYQEYLREKKALQHWFYHWVSHRTESPVRVWMHNWVQHKCQRFLKVWLRSWVSARTISKTKVWLKSWARHHKQNRAKYWLCCWTRARGDCPLKVWLYCWVYVYGTSQVKKWFCNWARNRSTARAKCWMRSWVFHRTHNEAKLWLSHWCYPYLIPPVKSWLFHWISSRKRRSRRNGVT